MGFYKKIFFIFNFFLTSKLHDVQDVFVYFPFGVFLLSKYLAEFFRIFTFLNLMRNPAK